MHEGVSIQKVAAVVVPKVYDYGAGSIPAQIVRDGF
jgi:hypothetical protein